jgi:hypothetical protein
LFMVVKCIETRPPVYLVKDDHGEILEGTFYGLVSIHFTTINNSSVQLGKYPFLNVRLALLSRTLSPGENLHDLLGFQIGAASDTFTDRQRN